MNDPLIDAILADPASDDARLVWADREGGERGELVVVQCTLERLRRVDEASRLEMKRLYAREAELMRRARAWHGFKIARVRRGFVEHAAVTVAELLTGEGHVFERAPLLESIDVTDKRAQLRDLFASLPRGIRAVKVALRGEEPPNTPLLHDIGRAERTRTLRSLEVYGRAVGTDVVGALAELRELEALNGAFVRDWPELLRALPRLSSLAATGVEPGIVRRALDALARTPPRLRALAFHRWDLGDDDARLIAESPAFSALEELTIAHAELTNDGVRTLARSPVLAGLTSLDLSGNRLDDLAFAYLSGATFAPRLRSLSLADTRFTAGVVWFLRAFPALERVFLRTGYGSTDHLHAIDDMIPFVSR